MKVEHSRVRKSNPLWQRYGLPYIYIYIYIYIERFLRFWRHPVLLDDECKIDWKHHQTHEKACMEEGLTRSTP